MDLPTTEIKNNLEILKLRKKFSAFSSSSAFFDLSRGNKNPSIKEVN